MIVTAQDMYEALQDELNKEATGTIFPDEAERLLNRTQLDYIVGKYDEAEKTQKRIDDLREVTVIGESILNTGSNTAGGEIFALPYSATANVTTVKNPSGTNRGYLFLLNAAFKIAYVDNSCFTGISGYQKRKPMKSDIKFEIARDPFNKPTDERLYHQTTGDRLLLFTGTSSYGTEVLIDYIRYPRDIVIQGNSPVSCELSLHAILEVVKLAARRWKVYTESPTYQPQLIDDRQTVQ